jgi:hypothetical protein
MKFYNKDGNHLKLEINGEIKPVKLKACFPFLKPREYISVLGEDGKELGFINSIKNLDEDSKLVVSEHLKFLLSGFEITNIIEIFDEYGIRFWRVETNKGSRSFQTEISARPVLMNDGVYRLQDLEGDLYLLNRNGISVSDFDRYIA